MPVNKLLHYLSDNFKQADDAVNHLMISAERCKNFFDNEDFTEEQLIDLEALTGRFARLSDILIQKILKKLTGWMVVLPPLYGIGSCRLKKRG